MSHALTEVSQTQKAACEGKCLAARGSSRVQLFGLEQKEEKYVGGKKCVKQNWCKVSADLLGGILKCWGPSRRKLSACNCVD